MSRGHWQSKAALSLMAESGNDDPREAILAKAREAIEDLGLDEPPFPPRIIASYCGIEDVQEVPLDLAGCILPVSEDPPRLRMLLRRQDGIGRRNFTCNHETAHTLFPSYWQGPLERKDRHTGGYGRQDEEEYLCDLAAAELLMPREPFAFCALDHGLTPDAVPHLSSLFRSSMEATARRLVDLKLWRGGVIMWAPDWTSSQREAYHERGEPLPHKKLRVRFSHMGGDLAKSFVPKGRACRAESLIGECHRTGKPTNGWDEVPVGSSWRMVHLQCAKVGPGGLGGVLSVVSAQP